MIETAEAYSQSPGDIRVLLAPNTAKLFRSREKASGSGFILQGGRIDDVPALVSNSMPTASMLITDFSRVTEARWGAMQIEVTPHAAAAKHQAGIISVRVMASVDFGIDHPAGLAKSTSIT